MQPVSLWKEFLDWLLRIGAWPVIITFILFFLGACFVVIISTLFVIIKWIINPTASSNLCLGHGASAVGDYVFDPIGFGSAKVDNDKAIELPIRPNKTNHALISVEENPIRYRYDGGNPTPSEGHLVQAGDSMSIHFSDTEALSKFRVISVRGQATIQVTYSNYKK
jgi:hypothetical protein